jgi:trimethylamine:corrinoid methyltransferase-like protein
MDAVGMVCGWIARAMRPGAVVMYGTSMTTALLHSVGASMQTPAGMVYYLFWNY